jgi:hypothetical protein
MCDNEGISLFSGPPRNGTKTFYAIHDQTSKIDSSTGMTNAQIYSYIMRTNRIPHINRVEQYTDACQLVTTTLSESIAAAEETAAALEQAVASVEAATEATADAEQTLITCAVLSDEIHVNLNNAISNRNSAKVLLIQATHGIHVATGDEYTQAVDAAKDETKKITTENIRIVQLIKQVEVADKAKVTATEDVKVANDAEKKAISREDIARKNEADAAETLIQLEEVARKTADEKYRAAQKNDEAVAIQNSIEDKQRAVEVEANAAEQTKNDIAADAAKKAKHEADVHQLQRNISVLGFSSTN